jgi:hypothetical protein
MSAFADQTFRIRRIDISNSCVSNGCNKATIDINSAVSIYDGYCTSAGYHRASVTTPATTTGMQGSPSTVTVTAVATVTVSSAKRQVSSSKGILLAQLVGSFWIRDWLTVCWSRFSD